MAGKPRMTRAVYDHDCDKCVFLGHHFDRDMYYCDLLTESLLFRFGDTDAQYLEQFPYSIHRTILMALASEEKAPSGTTMVVKRLTLGRLLADDAGLKTEPILVKVTRGEPKTG